MHSITGFGDGCGWTAPRIDLREVLGTKLDRRIGMRQHTQSGVVSMLIELRMAVNTGNCVLHRTKRLGDPRLAEFFSVQPFSRWPAWCASTLNHRDIWRLLDRVLQQFAGDIRNSADNPHPWGCL